MAKFNGSVVVIEESNLPAAFYYKYLIESENSEVKYPPVFYYDEIDKKGIDLHFESVKVDLPLEMMMSTNDSFIESVTKTCYHGFKYNTVHDRVTDEGLAKKQAQKIAKEIKNHEAPYNGLFKKYSVHVYNS